MPNALRKDLPTELGATNNAARITVNVSFDVARELRRISVHERISESSIIEIGLRQLFRRVTPERLGAFLKQKGACLRRRS